MSLRAEVALVMEALGRIERKLDECIALTEGYATATTKPARRAVAAK